MKNILFKLLIPLLLLFSAPALSQVQLYQYKAYVIRLDSGNAVQDGDTFHAFVSLGFDVYKDVTIRLASINAPEMKGADSVAAKKAKDYLTKRILGKTIYFNSKSYDKYHRSIAVVWLSGKGGLSINDEMVQKGLAKYQKY